MNVPDSVAVYVVVPDVAVVVKVPLSLVV